MNGLEKYAIEKAMANMGGILENRVAPKYKILTFQKPFIESLYDEVKFMMAALGVELVAPATAAAAVPVTSKQKAIKPVSTPSSTTSQGGTSVSMTRRGISVSGNYSGGSKGALTLLAGSTIDMGAKIQAKDKGTPTLRQQLLAQGKLINQSGNLASLTEDVTFSSPTAAAQFVYGGAINGRIYWKDANGKSIKDVWG